MGKVTNHEVGYGKPPQEHQFRKGRSGNPRGRPRRRKRTPPHDLVDGFAQALLNDHRVHLDGRPVKVPLFVVWTEKLIRDSFSATVKERLALLDCLTRLGVGGRLRDLKAEEEEPEPEIFTDADRLLLEQVEKAIAAGVSPDATATEG
jgi:hypothetical protein